MRFANSVLNTHSSWHSLLFDAFDAMDPIYLNELSQRDDWLPGCDKLLAAFQVPLDDVQYILLGESPYPRSASANGYAFWDAQVQSLWSETGLSKAVNRATSLRNMIKMLLHARGDLVNDFSQAAIARLDKSSYVQTADQLFGSFIKKGFLLLNASLVYSEGKVNEHAKYWRPFMASLFSALSKTSLSLQFVLLGRIAKQLPEARLFPLFEAEHPYNISFFKNPDVLAFFNPFDLLTL